MPSPWSVAYEPVFVVLAAAAVAFYVRAWRRAPGPAWRAWSFGIGIALIVGALNSPLETIAIQYLVLFHLLQNVMISDWAPPLLLIGLTPSMRAAIASRGGSLVETITRPAITLPTWLLAWYVIHIGPVYDTAVRSDLLLGIEHAVLIAIGIIFWWPVLCDVPRSVPTLGRIGYVLAAFVFSAFLGLALTFSPPLYPYYEDRPRLWGITAEQDQNLGGILMSTEQAVVFFSAIVWLLVRLLREEAEAEERLAAEQRAAGLREH
jgi:cytochrome c oxidase assembly factor CtaG